MRIQKTIHHHGDLMMDIVGGVKRSKYALPPSLGSTPWIVLPHGRHKQIQTFFNPIDGSLHHRSIPEMRHKKCLGCSKGWLLMLEDPCNNSRECFLLNIASKKIVSLPPLSGLPDYPIAFTLSSASSTNPLSLSGCMVVLVVAFQIIFCRLHEEKGTEWTKRKVDLDNRDYLNGGVAWLNGKLYLDTHYNRLVIVDFSAPIVSVHLLRPKLMIYMLAGLSLKQSLTWYWDSEKSILSCRSWDYDDNDIKLIKSAASYRQSLVVSCGQILTVVLFLHRYNGTVTKAEVFKLDFSELEWERVETIGDDQAIFVGDCGAACIVKDERVEGNCIYFMQPSCDGMRWYKFSLNDRLLSYTLFYPGLHKTWQNSYLAMSAN